MVTETLFVDKPDDLKKILDANKADIFSLRDRIVLVEIGICCAAVVNLSLFGSIMYILYFK